MKLNIISILICCVGICGCKKDFLDRTPLSEISTDNFYTAESDYRNAVNATYSALQVNNLYGSVYSHLSEVPADNVTVESPTAAGGRDQDEIDRFYMSSTSNSVALFYTGSYAAIQRCNIVTDRLEQSAVSDALKARFSGEVQFIRALVYFNLVRFYGDVPLILVEVKSAKQGYEYARTPAAEVYAQIINDLKDAEAKLPVSYAAADIGRATKGAAQSLLAKVYLTLKDYPAALTKLNQVISSGTYDLLPVYKDVFDPSKSNGKESIFEIQYKGGGTGEGSQYNNTSALNGARADVVGAGAGNATFLFPTLSIVKAFPTGDLRKNTNIDSSITTPRTFFCRKYIHSTYGVPLFAANDGDNNWIVLRYADVLLMRAEVLNKINNGPTATAYDDINRVRRRAYGLPITTASVARDLPIGLNKDDFDLAIENERRLELAFEGHRWPDLVRTGRAIPVMTALGLPIKPHHVLFPIPRKEIEVNSKITQNPGYN